MIGQNLAHYRVLEEIGSGGMGVVYRAQDEKLGRQVAIKVLPAGTLGDSTARHRLLREARAAAALNHPHICIVHEVGESDSQAYIAMEYVEGRPLSEEISSGGIPTEKIVRYGIQLSDALSHAHRQGIIHRDLKPANVVITSEGRPKILDFGLAKWMPEEVGSDSATASKLTEEGTVVGTFPYLAPEQLRGQSADARTDIWALGVVLYEMAVGVRPFHGKTRFELSSAILTSEAPPLPDSIPAELRSVILRCLEKQPGQRYQQAGEVRAALEAVQSGGSSRIALLLFGRRTMAAALALLAAGVLAVVVTDRSKQPSSPTRPDRSVVVLPFASPSPDPDQQSLVDGLHNRIIRELAQIRSLRVISHTSAAKYRDSRKSLPEIARELGVDEVVEGSVSLSGDRVRMQVGLIRAGPQEQQLWSKTFERGLNELRLLPGDVARGVAEALDLKLAPDDYTRQARARTGDREAYEAYLRGMHHLNTFTPEGTRKGLEYLHQAVDRDPADPHAYAGLAVGYALVGHGSGTGSGPEGFAKARAAAIQALKLDETIAEAHGALAVVKAYNEWDWEGAQREFERALELNPNADEVHRHYAWLHVLFGRMEDAVRELKLAQEINPLRPVHFAEMGWIHLYTGDYDRAITEAKKALELNPKALNAHYVLGRAYAGKGMFDQAVEIHQRLRSLNPQRRDALATTLALAGRKAEARAELDEMLKSNDSTLRSFYLAQVYAALGDNDEAFRWARTGFEQRTWALPWIFEQKIFSSLRKDPRYRQLMSQMNVPVR